MGDHGVCINPADPEEPMAERQESDCAAGEPRYSPSWDDYVDIRVRYGLSEGNSCTTSTTIYTGREIQPASIDIFNDNGTLSEAAGLYVGMDHRFDVREQIEKDLSRVPVAGKGGSPIPIRSVSPNVPM